MNRPRSLRLRLAVLYACLLLACGVLLLAVAGLPLTTFGDATPAHPAASTGAATGARPGFVTNLVSALLALAGSQRGLRTEQPFDLAGVTARVIAAREEEAARLGVRVEARLAPAVVTGDPSLTESLVANLVDNAVRHNVTGGEARVTTAAPGGLPTLRVANSGPVIPPDEVGMLLEPFRQLGGERRRRSGHGLGLAIVAAVASAHDAGLSVRARPEGGLDVTVTFPA